MNAPTRRLLTAHFLIVRIGRGHHEMLRTSVKNGLLHKISTIRQAGHLNLQGHRIFYFTHVGIDVQGRDLSGGRIESKRHLIAGLGLPWWNC